MCKEMPVIPVDKVVDKKRIVGKNGRLRRRRGTIFCSNTKNIHVDFRLGTAGAGTCSGVNFCK
jgi:hypothetical protein